MSKKYSVTLTAEERARLEEMTRSGKAAARKIAHARILLKADVAEGGPGWPDEHSAAALDVSARTVRRIRLLFVEEGRDRALNPRPAQRVSPTTLDGAGEAHLIALTCSAAPEGRAPLEPAPAGRPLRRARVWRGGLPRNGAPDLKKTNCSRG